MRGPSTLEDADARDFFISYSNADAGWAAWIAWQLEENGYTTVLQEWDFRPGHNFVVEMDRAASKAARTIIVLSPSFLASSFVQPEWAAAFARDPRGASAQLIPVRVEACDVAGMLGQIVYIDFVGLSRETASRRLIDGVRRGRAKPEDAPPYPGSTAEEPSGRRAPLQELVWDRLEAPVEMRWRDSFLQPQWSQGGGSAVVELVLVQQGSVRLQVRQLQGVKEQLAMRGRSSGLFSQSQPLDTTTTDAAAIVKVTADGRSDDAGLLVTRDCQLTAWSGLPRDMLGSIFDGEDVKRRLMKFVDILLSLDEPQITRVAPAVALRPVGMLSIGLASEVGNRTRAAVGSHDGDIVVEPEDVLSVSQLRRHTDQLAEELVARLSARLARLR